MSALSSLGILHTAISLVAVLAGIAAFIRHFGITAATLSGRVYIVTTILTCVSGFFIFAHGGFGKPHALGIITLLVVAIAIVAHQRSRQRRGAIMIETVAYSLTFYFHMIPAMTETATRLPAAAPLLDSPDAPALQVTSAVLFVIFLLGARRQLRRLRNAGRKIIPLHTPVIKW